mmetsp:Transcript_5567/g.12718  ORF Transcript_5567/g.12718 Transcript_5567/m.12718 type:complete len:228 (+) Transcript_5567:57-740(+)
MASEPTASQCQKHRDHDSASDIAARGGGTEQDEARRCVIFKGVPSLSTPPPPRSSTSSSSAHAGSASSSLSAVSRTAVMPGSASAASASSSSSPSSKNGFGTISLSRPSDILLTIVTGSFSFSSCSFFFVVFPLVVVPGFPAWLLLPRLPSAIGPRGGVGGVCGVLPRGGVLAVRGVFGVLLRGEERPALPWLGGLEDGWGGSSAHSESAASVVKADEASKLGTGDL